MNTAPLSPQQLDTLLKALLLLYTQSYTSTSTDPRYKHIEIGNIRFKIGYHFDNEREPITIRIVEKGHVNDK